MHVFVVNDCFGDGGWMLSVAGLFIAVCVIALVAWAVLGCWGGGDDGGDCGV